MVGLTETSARVALASLRLCTGRTWKQEWRWQCEGNRERDLAPSKRDGPAVPSARPRLRPEPSCRSSDAGAGCSRPVEKRGRWTQSYGSPVSSLAPHFLQKRCQVRPPYRERRLAPRFGSKSCSPPAGHAAVGRSAASSAACTMAGVTA